MTYSYRCPECGVEVDRACSFAERDGLVCECGAKLERVFTTAGVRFLIPERFHTNKEDIEGDPYEKQVY